MKTSRGCCVTKLLSSHHLKLSALVNTPDPYGSTGHIGHSQHWPTILAHFSRGVDWRFVSVGASCNTRALEGPKKAPGRRRTTRGVVPTLAAPLGPLGGFWNSSWPTGRADESTALPPRPLCFYPVLRRSGFHAWMNPAVDIHDWLSDPGRDHSRGQYLTEKARHTFRSHNVGGPAVSNNSAQGFGQISSHCGARSDRRGAWRTFADCLR